MYTIVALSRHSCSGCTLALRLISRGLACMYVWLVLPDSNPQSVFGRGGNELLWESVQDHAPVTAKVADQVGGHTRQSNRLTVPHCGGGGACHCHCWYVNFFFVLLGVKKRFIQCLGENEWITQSKHAIGASASRQLLPCRG